MKILSGIVLMPFSWLVIAGILYYFGFGWKSATVSIPLSFLCGYIALRSLEEIAELKGWLKAITTFLKQDKFIRLLVERKRFSIKLPRKIYFEKEKRRFASSSLNKHVFGALKSDFLLFSFEALRVFPLFFRLVKINIKVNNDFTGMPSNSFGRLQT